MASSNYTIPSDSMNGGGGEVSTSASYQLRDTVGQDVIGSASSAAFAAQQGYRVQSGAATLSADFVDVNGGLITFPTASFSAVTSGVTAANGSLTSANSKIRVTNTRAVAPWSLTIAATAGPAAYWNSSGNLLGFNHPGANAALTVNPSGAGIAPLGTLCTDTGLTRGASATFDQGLVDSITLLTAGGGADVGCAWDLTNIPLTQTLPDSQPAGNYSLSMTITVA